LLVLGHVLGDFTFQTDELAANKHRAGALVTHTVIVVFVHVLAFIPLLTTRTIHIVLLVGILHLFVDAASARWRKREQTSAWLFLGDQTVHLIALVGVWYLCAPAAWTASPVLAAVNSGSSVPWSTLTAGAMYVSAFAFANEGGNAIVRGVLPEDGPEPDDQDDLEVGSLIGTLERWIVLLLGFAGRWEAVVLVVGVKSIARFEELKERTFAEYFLVGTLTSVLVAITTVILVSFLV
jgi:hypothetical protein